MGNIINLQYKRYRNKNNKNFIYFLYTLKFFGFLIVKGQKKEAYKKWNELKYTLKKIKKESFFDIFFKAMLNITPKIGLKKKRLGALKKEIPIPLSGFKKVSYAIKWFFKILKEQQTFKVINMANLILDSYDNKGKVVKLKKVTYQIGVLNKYLINLIKR